MRPADLQSTLRSFSAWLSSSEVLHSPRLSHLLMQKIHEMIHQEALRRVAKAYKSLCSQIRKPENRYGDASTLLGGERPFGRVDLLYQILGLEEEEGSGGDAGQQLEDGSEDEDAEEEEKDGYEDTGEEEESEGDEEGGPGVEDVREREQI